MNRRPTDIATVVLCCVVGFQVSSVAADCDRANTTLADIRTRGALRVGHTNDYRPFTFRAPDGTPTGIDVDVAERFAASLGVEIEWVDTSWSTLSADLAADRFDVAMSGVSITAERAAVGCFSAPYFTTGKTAMTRCAATRRFTTLAELDAPDVTVVVNRGGTNERFVAARLAHARVIVRDDNRAAIATLVAGGADVMITDAIEARVESRDNSALCVADPPILFDDVRKAYYFADDAGWKAWIDAHLADLRANGAFDAIVARYAPERTK